MSVMWGLNVSINSSLRLVLVNWLLWDKSALGNIPTTCNTINANNDNQNILFFDISEKRFTFGQGIYGRDMTKFDELKVFLSDQANRNLHVFGISETKLNIKQMTNAFNIDVFQVPFRKDNHINGDGR